MSTLTYQKIQLPAGRLGKANAFPLLFKPGAFEKGGRLDETEGLFLNYGKVMHTLPYTGLDDYDHGEEPREFDAFVLENRYLRAVFLPALGGRMWSLYDKEDGRDLVINNPVFRPCNLALRNAWFSGGVEWNCGVRGHHPLTCDKVYAAQYTADDGAPVLRLYAFERMRAITYQMDFFLPDDSRNLYARMRLVNASDRVTPVYWWSTIAVEQKKGARVIVPASETYVNHSTDPVYKCPIPVIDGVDLSYPTNHTEATDHFYKIPEDSRKFEAYLDKDGVGLVHASTARLKGRKMFVWGTSRGGENWQRFLTNRQGERQPYLEIQAGLAYTQNESLPCPPHTAWEWLEAYCPARLAPEQVHGEYQAARRSVEAWLDEHLPESCLDNMLKRTKKEALKHVPYTCKGHPWGALDNMLRSAEGREPISGHLPFGDLEDEQLLWARFLKNGCLDEPDAAVPPASYMVQDEWFVRLRQTVKQADKYNWNAWYHLGICWYARDEYELAGECFEASLSLQPSTWAYHALACTRFSQGNVQEGANLMEKALERRRNDAMLAKEALRLCAQFGAYETMLTMYDILDGTAKKQPLIQAYYAVALANTGALEEARTILERDGGLVIDDIREGDDLIAETYIQIMRQLAAREGRECSEETISVPESLDFRMFQK